MLSKLIALFALLSVAAGPVNLSIDQEATKKIASGDPSFLGGFEIYRAGVKEAPLALLLDRKGDGHNIASYLWGASLGRDEILYALRRLEEQYMEPSWCLPLPPAALRVVNRKGEVLGYVYTSLRQIFMERKGEEVKVFLPDHSPCDGDGWEEIPSPPRP
ncbi:MAG: hypothetical protein DRG33_00280 [Deltaproteobacteria bacterium]|nr:MAG: hypothetical protein DRG33_00280 [Deltaproteobacteria bacterium]HEX15823.1 hypothetical protein [Deltaproteobacteria bacterium]